MSWTFLSFLIIAVGYYLFREMTGWLKLYKYKRQGIKHVKFCTTPGMFYKAAQSGKLDDEMAEEKKDMSEQDPDQPFNVVNFGSQCFLNLISEKAIKDFYAQEIEATIKPKIFGSFKFLGFLFENGKEVQEKRAIFAKMFHYSNVLKLMPNLRGLIKRHVRNLKKRAVAEGGQVKIDLKKEFTRALLDDLSACILLGGADNKVDERFEGMNITQIIQKMIKLFKVSSRNPLHTIPLVTHLGFNKQLNEIMRLKMALIEIIRTQYAKRYNNGTLLEKSVLDIMVKLNKESEIETGKPKFSFSEITSIFELFQFAAGDTSFQLSSTAITYLALPENQVYQRRIQDEVESELDRSDTYSNEKLNSLKEVGFVFRETTRLANPVTGLARVAIKDFKVDGYTVYKGDRVDILICNYEPKHFADPLRFNPDRFNEDRQGFMKAPRMKHLPFSVGQRACLGKYLGEMMVKMIILELLREFEVSVEPGYTMKLRHDPLYGVINPDLIMTVRGSQ